MQRDANLDLGGSIASRKTFFYRIDCDRLLVPSAHAADSFTCSGWEVMVLAKVDAPEDLQFQAAQKSHAQSNVKIIAEAQKLLGRMKFA